MQKWQQYHLNVLSWWEVPFIYVVSPIIPLQQFWYSFYFLLHLLSTNLIFFLYSFLLQVTLLTGHYSDLSHTLYNVYTQVLRTPEYNLLGLDWQQCDPRMNLIVAFHKNQIKFRIFHCHIQQDSILVYQQDQACMKLLLDQYWTCRRQHVFLPRELSQMEHQSFCETLPLINLHQTSF